MSLRASGADTDMPQFTIATSKELPRISIITPCYNRAGFIRHAIESVIAQDYPNYEHIVVDGASTDGTLEILAEYPHLRVISEPDNGLYDAVNKGLKLAQGDLIGWLNSDDRYVAGAFHKVARAFQANPHVDMVCGDTVFIEEDRHGHSVKRNKLISRRPQFDIGALIEGYHINAYFITPRLYRQVGTYNSAYRVVGDSDLLYRLSFYRPAMVHVEDVLYEMYIHERSLTKSHTAEAKLHHLKESAQMNRSWLRMRIPDDLREFCRQRLVNLSAQALNSCIELQRWDQAAKWMWLGCRYAPRRMGIVLLRSIYRFTIKPFGIRGTDKQK